ncbi:MAG: VWA domain-containing protein [Acidobacteriota bacterium]
MPRTPRFVLTATTLAALLIVTVHGQQPPAPRRGAPEPGFRFRSGVELITVTATVTDQAGRFVPGLRQEDFVVYEDDQPVDVTHFSAERVPVSLGILLDTSTSMAGEKLREALGALDRFSYDLLDQQDELFLYRFSNYPALVQGWTTDRQLISRALGRMTADGGTAMYDAVIEALPLAARGRYAKKALVVISDGNDTSSGAEIRLVKQRIRESEVLVYAIGLDSSESERKAAPPPPPRRVPFPVPRPFPPRRPGPFPFQTGLPQFGSIFSSGDDRVNVAALRDMTDDSGGRTEIVREARDLNPATAAIADELSKQYNLGYPSPGKNDREWHSIRVEVRRGAYRVRARRGYVAN